MNNEITVRLNCSIKEIQNILKNKGFELSDKFSVSDTYYIPKNIEINKLSINSILNSCILIRDIDQYDTNFINSYKITKITYKHKNIAQNGDIINQEKYDCEIKNITEGKNLLDAIGYKRLMDIREETVVYSKDGIKIEIKDVKNGDNLIEIETLETNEVINTIEKLKQKIEELEIPIDKSNFFVKKAENELKKMLGDL